MTRPVKTVYVSLRLTKADAALVRSCREPHESTGQTTRRLALRQAASLRRRFTADAPNAPSEDGAR